ncbi:MAG TPA: hypothetical protein VFE27_06280 [Acidobacteriaceae bacterium]|jgi:hypothetical protein|nr:hypothetical protein [Acidobacteriaceae bacterium]
MRWGLIGGVVVAASVSLAAGQFNVPVNPAATDGQMQQLDHARVPDEQPYVAREMQERQLKKLREEHQKEVFSDADRLVQLATALKAAVDKRDKAPTLEAIKDVDEIAKLAKRVSDRIKTQ